MGQSFKSTIRRRTLSAIPRSLAPSILSQWGRLRHRNALEHTFEDVAYTEPCTYQGQVLFTSRSGLLHYRQGRLKRILDGNCYGLTRVGQRWLVFRQQSEVHGHIVSFRLGDAGAAETRIEIESLHAEVHQIDFDGEQLLVTDTANNRLLVYKPNRGKWCRWRAVYPAGRAIRGRKSENYVHLNSVFVRRGTVCLMFHNYSKVTGKTSQIIELDDSFRIARVVETDARDAHNVAYYGDELLYCDSRHRRLVLGENSIEVDGFTRGLALTSAYAVVGVSDFAPKAERNLSHGSLHFCDLKDLSVRATLSVASVGGIHEIRAVDCSDFAMSIASSE